MRELKRIGVVELERDCDQPRKLFDESELLALGQNMKLHGQQVPVIAYRPEATEKPVRPYRLLDGERRWRAAQLVSLLELDAIVLAQRPTQTALHVLQMSLEAHKQGLTLMERSHLLHRIRTENGWPVVELAEKLNMRQPLVTKLLAYQKLDPTVQAMLDKGELDMEKAFMLTQEPDAQKQKELARAALTMDRDQLRKRLNPKREGDVAKAAIAKFALAGGVCVTVQGRDITLDNVIEALSTTVKQLRRGQGQGLDVTTAQRIMRDKAKAGA